MNATDFSSSSPGQGIYSGVDPLAEAISLFLVQATIIIGLCRFLGFIGYSLRQPPVVFEIAAGIILGPSALSKDTYFKNTIFPSESLDNLSIVANIGLTFYLFIVGIEMDIKLLKTHAKKTALISIAGIAIPFVIGIALLVFIGTAMSITAFPVLARMLKDGGLIYTNPGSMALGAAAVDDAVAWTLLALSISIANGQSMNQAGYIFATIVLIALFLLFFFKPLFEVMVESAEVRKNKIITSNLFALVVCLLFMCAWTTALIGLDSIFGAFLFGVTIPRGTNLFYQCHQYIEVFVLTVTLPIYFALLGLKTDVTTISTGRDVGVLILVCLLATASKFLGVGAASILSGLSCRESVTVAVLMNTRGLVELIVLNVGLSAGLLTTKTVTVMVLMALFTTFMTGPLVELIYPRSIRKFTSQVNEERFIGRQSFYEPSTFKKVLPCRMSIVVSSLDQLQLLVNFLGYFLPLREGSHQVISIMHFYEPTNSENDHFIELNTEGRLVRVDEESTDIMQALHSAQNNHTMFKPDLFPITCFCNAFHIPVNAFKIEGDPTEYPWQLKTISKRNSCSCVGIPFKPNSLFAENLFWRAVQILTVPAFLLVPLGNDRTENVNEKVGSNYQDSRKFYSNISPNAFPHHLQASISAEIHLLPVLPRRSTQIITILLGIQGDELIFPLLDRFLENNGNELTIFLPKNYREFPECITSEIANFRNSNRGICVELRCDSHDYEEIFDSIASYVFDLLVFSFIPPKEDPSRRIEESINANVLNFFSAPSQPHTRTFERRQRGIPEHFIHSTLKYPELGIFGNLVFEREYSFPSMAIIVHQPLDINSQVNSQDEEQKSFHIDEEVVL